MVLCAPTIRTAWSLDGVAGYDGTSVMSTTSGLFQELLHPGEGLVQVPCLTVTPGSHGVSCGVLEPHEAADEAPAVFLLTLESLLAVPQLPSAAEHQSPFITTWVGTNTSGTWKVSAAMVVLEVRLELGPALLLVVVVLCRHVVHL